MGFFVSSERQGAIVGLAKVYALMSGAVCLYLAADRGLWVALPFWALSWLLTIIAGRLLWRSIRGSRRGSLWPSIATFTTWLLLVTTVIVAGVALVAIEQGGV